MLESVDEFKRCLESRLSASPGRAGMIRGDLSLIPTRRSLRGIEEGQNTLRADSLGRSQYLEFQEEGVVAGCAMLRKTA